MEGQIVAVLVQNLERLDESVKDESEGVHNTLGMSFDIISLYLFLLIKFIYILTIQLIKQSQ